MPTGADDERIFIGRTGQQGPDISIVISLNDDRRASSLRRTLDDLNIVNSFVHVGDFAELKLWLKTFNGSIARLLLHIPSSLNGGALFTQLDLLADEVSEATQVFGFGEHLNGETEDHLRRIGFRDYFSDATPDYVIKTCLAFPTIQIQNRTASVIAVIGVAGGVGASLFCLGLADQIVSHANTHVTIIDGHKPDRAIAHLLGRPKNIEQSALQNQSAIKIADRIHLIEFHNRKFNKFESAAENRDLFVSIDTHYPSNEIVIIDCSLTMLSSGLLSQCSDVILVAEPDLKCLNALSTHIDVIKCAMDRPKIHVAINKIGMPGRIEFDKSSFTFEHASMPIEFYHFTPRSVNESLATAYAAIPLRRLKDAKAFKRLLAQLGIGEHDLQPARNVFRHVMQKITALSIFR